MSTKDLSNDLISNEIDNNDDFEVVLEPLSGDDIDENTYTDNEVYVIGGGDNTDIDAAETSDAFIVDVDSDGAFDFAIADVNDDGMIHEDEILDITDLDLSFDDLEEDVETVDALDHDNVFAVNDEITVDEETQDFVDESPIFEDDLDDSDADGFDDFGL